MSKTSEADSGFTLSQESRQRIAALEERYPTVDSALMPCIWVIQDEFGYVPDEGVDYLVEALGVTRARVHEVLTFYTMFRTEPQAKYVLQVCHNISCHILGARSIIAHLEKRLGIRLGERTPDGVFQLEGVECLGACGLGPVLQLGKHFYEHLTPEKVDALLESLRKGVVPPADTDRALEEGA
ncbi:MAG: NAD(P)H-dependent oxidoreductase subunit E [Candidatus Krumholzibacteriia bacterium]